MARYWRNIDNQYSSLSCKVAIFVEYLSLHILFVLSIVNFLCILCSMLSFPKARQYKARSRIVSSKLMETPLYSFDQIVNI